MAYLQIGMVIGVILSLAFLIGYFIKSVRDNHYMKYPVTQDTLEAFQYTYEELDLDSFTYALYIILVIVLNLVFILVIMLTSVAIWPIIIFYLILVVIINLKYK